MSTESSRATTTSLRRRFLRLLGGVTLTLLMGVPLYLLATNAFKSQKDIISQPFGWPSEGFTFDNVQRALTAPDFNMIRAYAITTVLVIVVNVLSVLVTGPAAYAIARGTKRFHRQVLLVLLAGLFIPSQTIVIPVIYVLRTMNLMGSLPGLILFQTALTIPITLFLYVTYIRSIPTELDEAAKLDGAGRFRLFWRVIFPLMRPAIVTGVVLNSVGVWADFVNPRIILGTSSGIYTVTTGVYGAISQFSTDFTLVYSNMLLAVAPVIVFYILVQKKIIGGLTAGALKG